MFPYLPHTDREIADMLAEIGANHIEDLFADIPESIRLKKPLDIPEGISEYEVFTALSDLSQQNDIDKTSFLGYGSYDHIIPSVVQHIAGRAEFYTAYKPYQAEISQGILKAIFEFQTMICELTSLDVSNASLYDGHSAVCEAAAMALNSVKKANKILYSGTIHPHTKRILKTHFSGMSIELEEIEQEDGITSWTDLKNKLNASVAAVIMQTPNFLGYVEDYTGFADFIHERGALFVISSNPVSLAVLKSQGEWGADIAVGDTQPLGLSAYFGGPSVGYLAARMKLLRKMPGRIVGESIDKNGKRAFLLTLQAREQHIRRERATSNICSNQALAALSTAVHLAVLGNQGLIDAGLQNIHKAHYLYERLVAELPVQPLHDRVFFNEFPLRLGKPAGHVLKKMEEEGFWGGVALDRFYGTEFEDGMGIAVTEKRTQAELDRYVQCLAGILP